MPKRAALIEAEIDRRLAAVTPDFPDRVTGRDLRGVARDHLAEIDENAEEFPNEAILPHWTLYMSSLNSEIAVCAVVIFRPDCLEFFCGTGDLLAISRFCSENDPDIDSLFAIMSAQFHIPQPPLRIERRAAALWLGRGWKP